MIIFDLILEVWTFGGIRMCKHPSQSLTSSDRLSLGCSVVAFSM